MTKRICSRCGKIYTDLRVYVVNPGPGICPKCKVEIPGKVVKTIGDLFKKI